MVLAEPASLVELDIRRSPSFSLGTALMWLGHDCPGSCPAAADENRAAVWFLRLPTTDHPTWTRTLVDVEFLDPAASDGAVTALLAQVNRCVTADHLRVRRRSAEGRSTFIAALTARRTLADSVRSARNSLAEDV